VLVTAGDCEDVDAVRLARARQDEVVDLRRRQKSPLDA
jgi:hypothetical protein